MLFINSMKLINKITSCGRPHGEELSQLSAIADRATIRDQLSLGVDFQFRCCHLWYQSYCFELFSQRTDMAIRVGRGAGRRRGGPVSNVEVLGILQRFEARMDAMERR